VATWIDSVWLLGDSIAPSEPPNGGPQSPGASQVVYSREVWRAPRSFKPNV
jgi:hypothetical protein